MCGKFVVCRSRIRSFNSSPCTAQSVPQIISYREKEGLQSKRLTASLFMKEKRKSYEKTVHGEWQTCKEPPERKREIDRKRLRFNKKQRYVQGRVSLRVTSFA
eukprot:1155571-Pelagomonas_calceolata.AAC.1